MNLTVGSGHVQMPSCTHETTGGVNMGEFVTEDGQIEVFYDSICGFCHADLGLERVVVPLKEEQKDEELPVVTSGWFSGC